MAVWEIGFEGQTFEWDDGALLLSEAREIKKWLGEAVSPPVWLEMLSHDDADAETALICLLRRRAGETGLRFSDVDGDLKTLTFRRTDIEESDDDEDGEAKPDPTADVA